MYNPHMNQLNYDLNEIAQLVHEYDYKSTVHFGNIGVMSFVAAYIAAMQIDDLRLHHHEHWRNMEFLHQIIYMLRDFLLKPIWSAKQMKSDPVVKIPTDHRE